MTLRKLTLAAVATIALTSSAFAADQATSNWGVGAGYAFGLRNPEPSILATYLNDQFIVQGGVGYSNHSGTDHHDNYAEISDHAYKTSLSFGLRNMMNNQVSLDYGIGGSYAFVKNADESDKDPYSVGIYVGVDFMPVQNVLFTAGISPYTYARDEETVKHNDVFSVGQISVSYMF